MLFVSVNISIGLPNLLHYQRGRGRDLFAETKATILPLLISVSMSAYNFQNLFQLT
jgi:hypothetical protein